MKKRKPMGLVMKHEIWIPIYLNLIVRNFETHLNYAFKPL